MFLQYELTRNPLNAHKYSLPPQITTIKDNKYLCLVYIEDNETTKACRSFVTIYEISNLSIHFYFEVDYRVERYLFADWRVILYHDDTFEYYSRDKLIETRRVEGTVDFRIVKGDSGKTKTADCLMVLYKTEEGLFFRKNIEEDLNDKVNIETTGISLVLPIKNNKVLLVDGSNIYIYNITKNKLIYTMKISCKVLDIVETVDPSVFIITTEDGKITVYNIRNDKKIFEIEDFRGDKCLNSFQKYTVLKTDSVVGRQGKISILDLELQKTLQEFNGDFGFFLEESEIYICDQNTLSLYKKQKNDSGDVKYALFKKRDIIQSNDVEIRRRNEHLILNDKNSVFVMNPFKDEQNTFLYNTKGSITHCSIDNHETEYYSCVVSDKKAVTVVSNREKNRKLFERRADWIKVFSDLVIIAHETNFYIVHMKSLRVLFEFSDRKVNDCYIDHTTLILAIGNELKYFKHNFIDFKEYKTIETTGEVLKIEHREEADFVLVKTENVSPENKSNPKKKIKQSKNTSVEVSNPTGSKLIVYLSGNTVLNTPARSFDLNGNYLVVANGHSGHFYKIVGCELEKLGIADFGGEIRNIFLLRHSDYIVVQFESGKISFYTIGNINSHVAVGTAAKNEELAEERLSKEMQFLTDLNRNIQLRDRVASKSFMKNANALYNDIEMFKRCLSKEDVTFYLQGLTKEESNKIIEIIIKNEKLREMNHLVNSILQFKGKWIDKNYLLEMKEFYKGSIN